MGYVAVEYESGDEGSEDALKTHCLAQGCAHEEHRHDEDELHHGVAVAAQEPSREPRYDENHRPDVHEELGCEPHPEPETCALPV